MRTIYIGKEVELKPYRGVVTAPWSADAWWSASPCSPCLAACRSLGRLAPGAANPPVAAGGAAVASRLRPGEEQPVGDVHEEDVVGHKGGGEVGDGLLVPPVHHGHQSEEEEAGQQLGAHGLGADEGGEGSGYHPQEHHVVRHLQCGRKLLLNRKIFFF